jgi:hypothetical protein
MTELNQSITQREINYNYKERTPQETSVMLQI